MRRWLLGMSLLAVGSAVGCVRSTADVPGRGEGAFLTGSVVEPNLVEGGFQPAKGAIVRVVGTSASRQVDDRGFFAIERLPLGRLLVEVVREAAPGRPRSAIVLDAVNAKVDGQTIDLGEIRLLGTGSLKGRVYGRAEPLVPIAGGLAVVPRTALKSVTDDEGGYLVFGLPQGSFDLVVFAAGYAPGRITGVGVTANVESTVKDLILETSTGSVSFTVHGSAVLSGADDFSGVAVRFESELDPSRVFSTQTDSAGNYVVSVPVGVYRARFEHEGYIKLELSGIAVLEEGVIGLLPVTLFPGISGDLDGDGTPDTEDPDRDNDGCLDGADDFPSDPFACKDTDADGVPDELDPDDDDDLLIDAEEVSVGRDGFVTDPLRRDTDGDGFFDAADLCPTVASDRNEASYCVTPEQSQPMPTITTSTPSQGGPGTTVTISGTNFVPSMAANKIFFGGSGPTPPLSVQANRIEVRVPLDATSGTITLITGLRTVDAPTPFCFVPPPSVALLEPATSRPGATVRIFGTHLVSPGCRVPGPATLRARLTSASGNPIFAAPKSAPFTTTVGGERYETFEIVVPRGVITGPVTVESEDGVGSGSSTLTIDGLPTITQLLPARPIPGAPLTILGSGFSTSELDGDPLTVEFPGAAPVSPSLVTGSVLRVIVPDTAADGVLTVHHPAADVTTPLMLDAARAVVGVVPPIANAGAAVALIGRDLSTATQVRFGAAIATINGAPTPGSINVTVPVGAEPGHPEVTFSDAPTMLNSIGAFRLVDVVSLPVVTGFTKTFLGTGAGTDAVAFGSTTMQRFDGTSGALVGVSSPHGFGSIVDVATSPNGTRMLVVSSGAVWILTLPTLAVLGTCLSTSYSATGFGEETVTFDPTDTAAFITSPSLNNVPERDTLLQIDLATGTCETFDLSSAAAGDVLGAAWWGPGRLLLLHAVLGLGVFDIDPVSPTRGQYVEAPPMGGTAPAPTLFADTKAVFASNLSGRVWVQSLRLPLQEVTPPAPVFGRTLTLGARSQVVMTSDRRYGFAASQLLDLENGIVALEINAASAGTTVQYSTTVAHPTNNLFYGLASATGSVLRIEIRE